MESKEKFHKVGVLLEFDSVGKAWERAVTAQRIAYKSNYTWGARVRPH